MSSLCDQTIISMLSPHVQCIVYGNGMPEYLSAIVELHQHIQLHQINDPMLYLTGSLFRVFLNLIRHFPRDVRLKIGREITKGRPGLKEIGLIIPGEETNRCLNMQMYCVHDEGTFRHTDIDRTRSP